MRRNILPKVFSSFLVDLFSGFTRPGRKHFVAYVVGLVFMVKFRSIKRIARHFDEGRCDALHHFLASGAWDVGELADGVQRAVVPFVAGSRGRRLFVIDDTPVERHGRHIEGAGVHHGPGGLVRGQCAVTSLVRVGGANFLWDVRGYRPKKGCPAGQFKSKVDIADDILADAAEKLDRVTVVMDSWYACCRLLKRISSSGWTFVVALKSNRLVGLETHRTRVDNLAKGPRRYVEVRLGRRRVVRAAERIVDLPRFGQVKLVVGRDRKERRFIVTNDLDMPVEEVVRTYADRVWIETAHRDAKQHLGLGELYVRSWRAAQRHWALVVVSYNALVLWNLSLSKAKRRRTFGAIATSFRTSYPSPHGMNSETLNLHLAA